MAEKISDNISEIAKAIKALKSDAAEASRATKSLNEDLKLDPTNVELARQRFDALNNELQAYKVYQQSLIQQEQMLRAAQSEGTSKLLQLDKSSREYQSLEKKLQRYNSELVKTEKAADRTATQVKRLQAAINGINVKKAADEAAASAKKIQTYENAMTGLEKAGRRLQIVISVLAVAFGKMVNSSVELGTELYSLSKRYNATAEEIQTMNRALQLATGQSDLFTNSLSVLAKGMSDIAGNRGQKYTAALRAIGTSFNELSNMSRTEQFRTIIEGLQGIENESIRAAHAQTLLGESGQYIVGALQNGNYTLEEYMAQADKFGKITTENAQQLAHLGFQLEASRSQMQVAAATATINFAPALLNLYNLGNKYLLPLVTGLTQGSWALWLAGTALIGLKIVPAVIKWILAWRAAKIAQDNYTRAAIASKIAALGLIGVIGAVAFGLGNTALNAKSAENALGDFASTANDIYGGYADSLGASVEQSYASRNESTVNFNVDIYGHGDTAISDEAAQKTAILTVEQMNRKLGILTKGY